MSKTKLIIIFLCAGIVAAASGLIAMNIMEPKMAGNMISEADSAFEKIADKTKRKGISRKGPQRKGREKIKKGSVRS